MRRIYYTLALIPLVFHQKFRQLVEAPVPTFFVRLHLLFVREQRVRQQHLGCFASFVELHRHAGRLIQLPPVPALAFLPAVVFLIVFPHVPHGRLIGTVAVLICAVLGSLGLWKLALGAVQKPWGIFNVLNVGALVVLLVIAAYTGLFLALMTLKL